MFICWAHYTMELFVCCTSVTPLVVGKICQVLYSTHYNVLFI